MSYLTVVGFATYTLASLHETTKMTGIICMRSDAIMYVDGSRYGKVKKSTSQSNPDLKVLRRPSGKTVELSTDQVSSEFTIAIV